MPKDFQKCVESGGRVITKKLKDNKYMHICYLNGKSYAGEVKEMKEYRINKLISRIELNEFSGKKPTSEIEVLTEGYWEHPEYGAIEITPEDIDKFVDNFQKKVRKIDIAVDQEHKPDLGAAGWFKELKKVVENGVTKLKAVVEWTDMGKELLSKGIYKYFSPEFDFEYEDYETHEVFENVLLGGALTNRPYFKSLAPVQLSENVFISVEKGGENKMNEKENKELNAKPAEESKEVSEEAKKEVSEESKAEDNAEKKEEEVKEVKEGEEEEGEEEESEEEESEEEESKKEPEPIQASELNAKTFNELKSKIGVLEKKLRFKEVSEEVNGYIFSESNPNGRLLPKSKEVAQELLMRLSGKQYEIFKKFYETLPKMSTMIFEEVGKGDDMSANASEQLVTKATELSKTEGMTFGQALKKVSADNPELVKEVEKE